MRYANYACGSMEHRLNRRRFLQHASATAAAGSAVIGGLGSLAGGAAAKELQRNDMRIVIFKPTRILGSQARSEDGWPVSRNPNQRAGNPHL